MAKNETPAEVVAIPPEPVIRLDDFANHHKQPNGIELMAGFVFHCLKKNLTNATEKQYRQEYEAFKNAPVK